MTTQDQPQEKLSDQSVQWLAGLNDPALNHGLLKNACILCETLANDLENPTTLVAQGLTMASQLKQLKFDSDTLATAIVFPCFSLTCSAKDSVTETLGERVADLLVGAQRMNAIDTLQNRPTEFSHQRDQMDNLRKMLLAMVDDIRVVLIKLAERLTVLMNLRTHPETEQRKIAQQAMDLYAPLANRLGVGQLKWQIEDLAFRHIDPERYKEISKALNMRRTDRENYIHHVVTVLKKLLKEAHIDGAEISGRAKHIYSIDRKIQRKNVSFEEIYDSSAVRILVPSLQNCYATLGLVHTEWAHIPQEFDDYIAKPKPNGYRSIHTAVTGPENKNIEIQIRTYTMHEEAELGVAAHWKYKEGSEKGSTFEEKINWLRDVIGWQEDVGQEDPSGEIYKNIFKDRVYVFTPNGDVLDMAAGSTPLDFAYHIHTEIGHRCRGAKINGAMVPLTHPLKIGDRVEVITAKEGRPSRDWLSPASGYLKTSHALSKVRHWFRQQDHEKNKEVGQTIWEKTYRRVGINKNALNDVYLKFNFKSINDLLAAIGAGDIGTTTLLNRIRSIHTPQEPTDTELPIKKPAAVSQKTSGSYVSIEGVGNLLTQLARCCQPIPGDAIVGYITKGRGISIHQQTCRNIKQAIKYRQERIITVDWGDNMPQQYPVDLIIEANDHPHLIRDVSNVIATEKIPILGLNSYADKLNHRFYINLTIEIKTLDLLDQIVRDLQKIPDVVLVKRKK